MRVIVMRIVVSMAMTSGCADDGRASTPVDAMSDAFVCIQPNIRFADTGVCGLASVCINASGSEVFLPGIACNTSCDGFGESECASPGKGCQTAYVYDEGTDPSTRRFMQCWALDTTRDSTCAGSSANDCLHKSNCSPVYLAKAGGRKFDRCIDRPALSSGSAAGRAQVPAVDRVITAGK